MGLSRQSIAVIVFSMASAGACAPIQDSTDAGRDAPLVDTGLDPTDAPMIDSGMPVDAAPLDAPALDAPPVDAPPVDAALVDAPLVDAPSIDAPLVDAPSIDAPLVDAPSIDAGPPPTSCADVLARGLGSVDGPYTISPDGVATFTVYCDMTTAGGGWTLILNKLGDFPWSGWTRQTTTASTPHLRSSATPLADNQDLLAGIPGTRLMFVTGERGLTSRAVMTPDLGASFRTFYDSVWGVSGRWCGRAPTGTSAFELLFDGAVLDCYERAAPEGGHLVADGCTTPAGTASAACFGGTPGTGTIGDASTNGTACATHVFLGSGACGCGDTFTRVFIR